MSTNETFITEIQNFAYIILKYTEDNDIQDILILPFKSFTVLACGHISRGLCLENFILLTILSQKSSEALVGVNLEYTQNMDLEKSPNGTSNVQEGTEKISKEAPPKYSGRRIKRRNLFFERGYTRIIYSRFVGIWHISNTNGLIYARKHSPGVGTLVMEY
ncbi:hypothetical protein RhiirA5_428845 [Rhizophagus irregularis]|uniref:Uncharacterized protein n=1 Tax=Rhizophagus irregularis TaxID=588596 RepID=A0A2N0NZI6_9GLOM|nr:hypothetical protein RhiirA5_428845 [Rhizophagus irregularis]